MRGSLQPQPPLHGRRWSIPARAGEPSRGPCDRRPREVYPRPCGGAATVSQPSTAGTGLSPPVRGSRGWVGLCFRPPGSIPARAGEPRLGETVLGLHEVYPRPCGGASKGQSRLDYPGGLSPPVRGSRQWSGPLQVHPGSIPARAGEPATLKAVPGNCLRQVYPRPCGGAIRPSRTQLRWTQRVYPRPCGGAYVHVLIWSGTTQGLSPPVRGSLGTECLRKLGTRSIPARAGEPPVASVSATASGVYPRPCGGAVLPITVTVKSGSHSGLSPPVRGSLPRSRWQPGHHAMRSIPARAGEPLAAGTGTSRELSGVYPRPCGGATVQTGGAAIAAVEGLSPPVRGSRAAPAPAELVQLIPVYPRPCGGSPSSRRRGPSPAERGLSPPVRGSHGRTLGTLDPKTAVYPRPCGGAPSCSNGGRTDDP